MKNKTMINWLSLTGVASVVFYLLHDIVGAANYPGYQWTSQAVSDLTASDAKSFVTASGFVTVYKILSCLCSAMICILIRKEQSKALRRGIYLFAAMNLVSAVGYALFPLTSSGYDGSPGSFVHLYIVTPPVVLMSIVSLILIAVGAFKTHRKVLGTLAVIALAAMFFGTVGSQALPHEWFGLVERFSTYSAVVFTGILGVYGFNADDTNIKES